MKKISLILAFVILVSVCLTSCTSISFFGSSAPQASRVDEKLENDFRYTVVGDGAGDGIINGSVSKVIISDGSGIQNGGESDDYGDESQGDDETSYDDGTPDNGNEGAPIITNVKIGDHITFGKYEQDNDLSNGKEEIEWLVLDIKDGRALVISKYALDSLKMHPNYDTISWETCWIRGWLNNDFMNMAFSAEQQSKIALTSLAVDPEPEFDGPDWGYNPGNPTQDKLFFLTVTEAERYFANGEARACLLTPYTESKNVNKMGGYADWWLRNGGAWEMMFSYVSGSSGYIYTNGANCNASGQSIRPAMWIELD
jgi:hypothetical protein